MMSAQAAATPAWSGLAFANDSSPLSAKQSLAFALLERAKKQEQKQPIRHRRSDGVDPMPFLDWTMLYRRELRPGDFFSLHDHLYLKDLYLDTSQETVYMKAGQIGISELLISYALHLCDQRYGDALYIMPTQQDVSDFSQSRFGPALEVSEYLSSIVISGGGGMRGVDKVSLKRIRDRSLYLRHGTVGAEKGGRQGRARQLKSIPVDGFVADELDEITPSAIPIAEKRLGHSPIKEIRKASTPSYPGIGIHAEWLVSDQREWFVKCPHCGHWQMLTIKQIVIEWDDLERPIAWHGQQNQTAWIVCEKKTCQKRLNRVGTGEWVATYRGREVTGFHPTKLMAIHTPLLSIVKKLQSLNQSTRKEAFNQDLGLPFTPTGGQLTREHLEACRREYGLGPVAGERPFAGIDVGTLLHIIIRAKANNEQGERTQRWIGTVSSFEEAARILKIYNVAGCVIDGLPETRKARELQASFPDGLVWLAYYNGGEKAPLTDFNKKEGYVNLNRTMILDEIYAGFYDGQTNTLPANAEEIEDYYDHLMAPKRQLEKNAKGEEVAIYIEDAPDHYAHAEAYCLAAEKRPIVQQASSKPNVVKRAEMFS